jgi:hypothetical protein
MTLGPTLMLLAMLDRVKGAAADVLAVYGRVPLFYYLLHLFLIHAISVAVGSQRHGLALYVVWVAVVAALLLSVSLVLAAEERQAKRVEVAQLRLIRVTMEWSACTFARRHSLRGARGRHCTPLRSVQFRSWTGTSWESPSMSTQQSSCCCN